MISPAEQSTDRNTTDIQISVQQEAFRSAQARKLVIKICLFSHLHRCLAFWVLGNSYHQNDTCSPNRAGVFRSRSATVIRFLGLMLSEIKRHRARNTDPSRLSLYLIPACENALPNS